MFLQNLGLFFLGLSFLQSLSIPPWMSFHSEIFTFIAIFFLFSQEVYSCNKLHIKITYSLAFPFILLLIISIQFFFGLIQYAGDLFIAAIYLFSSIIISIVASRASCTFTLKLAFLISTVSIASVLAAINQVFQVHSLFFLAEYDSFRRSSANLGQANNLGTLLVLGLISLIYLSEKLFLSKFTMFLLISLLLIGISITESRTALLNVTLFFATCLIKNNISFRGKIYFSLCYIFFCFFYVSWPTLIIAYHEVSIADIYSPNTTSSMRLEMWQQIIRAALKKPIFGWGFLNLPAALNSVQNEFLVTLPFTYSHNIIIDFIIWFGPLITLTIILCTIFYSIKYIEILKNPTKDVIYSLGIVSAIGLHSLLEYPFSYMYFLALFFFGTSYIENKKEIFKYFILSKNHLILILIIYIAIFSKSIVDYYYAEENFRNIRFENITMSSEAIHDQKYTILTQLDAMNFGIHVNPREIKNEKDFEKLKFAALRYPRYQLNKNYSIALILRGDEKEGKRQFEIIKNMYGIEKFNQAYAELINSVNPLFYDEKLKGNPATNHRSEK